MREQAPRAQCAIDEVADRLELPGLLGEGRELLGPLAESGAAATRPQLKKHAESVVRELVAIDAAKI